jgi:3-phosphoshikimate 1-carboxyvinyltransferase
MGRIATPLREMGAVVHTRSDGCAPLKIEGGHELRGIRYHSPVASAQVKSCVLLAGLYASGETAVVEPASSRDHTERMLRAFGANLPEQTAVRGGTKLQATDLTIPADFSSAAFFLAAGAMVPESSVRLFEVGLNPTRTGLLEAMLSMGCDIRIESRRSFGEEPVGDVDILWQPGIHAIDLPPEAVPSMIDELPALMALAALAEGTTRIRGAAELRVKESDRIAVMANALERLGFRVRQLVDGMDIEGRPAMVTVGSQRDTRELVEVDAAGDHRCAMSLCVLAQALGRQIRIVGAEQIDTSYPAFMSDLNRLGGLVSTEKEATRA